MNSPVVATNTINTIVVCFNPRSLDSAGATELYCQYLALNKKLKIVPFIYVGTAPLANAELIQLITEIHPDALTFVGNTPSRNTLESLFNDLKELDSYYKVATPPFHVQFFEGRREASSIVKKFVAESNSNVGIRFTDCSEWRPITDFMLEWVATNTAIAEAQLLVGRRHMLMESIAINQGPKYNHGHGIASDLVVDTLYSDELSFYRDRFNDVNESIKMAAKFNCPEDVFHYGRSFLSALTSLMDNLSSQITNDEESRKRIDDLVYEKIKNQSARVIVSTLEAKTGEVFHLVFGSFSRDVRDLSAGFINNATDSVLATFVLKYTENKSLIVEVKEGNTILTNEYGSSNIVNLKLFVSKFYPGIITPERLGFIFDSETLEAKGFQSTAHSVVSNVVGCMAMYLESRIKIVKITTLVTDWQSFLKSDIVNKLDNK